MLRAIPFYVLIALAIPYAFINPFAGACIYLILSHGRPDGIIWKAMIINYGLLIAIPMLIGYVLLEMRNAPLRMKGLVLIVVFWAWLGLATFGAEYPALAIPKFYEYTRLFLIVFVLAALANSASRIRTILSCIALSLGANGLKSAIGVVRTLGGVRIHGPGGQMGGENEYSLALDMAIPILFYLARTEDRTWLRRLMYMMVAGCAISVVGTHSRSGFLGLLSVAVLIGLHSKRRVLALSVIGTIVLLGLLVAPNSAIKRYKTIDEDASGQIVDMSAYSRIKSWDVAIAMSKDHPILGVGLRNFLVLYPRYSNFTPFEPHNVFLGFVAEAGIPSCIIFVALIFFAIVRVYRARKRLSKSPKHERIAQCLIGLEIALIIYVVPAFFNNNQSFDLLYHLIGITAAAANFVSMEERSGNIAPVRRFENDWLGAEAEGPVAVPSGTGGEVW